MVTAVLGASVWQATWAVDVSQGSSERPASAPVVTAKLRTPCYVAKDSATANKGRGVPYARTPACVRPWAQNLATPQMEAAVAALVGKVQHATNVQRTIIPRANATSSVTELQRAADLERAALKDNVFVPERVPWNPRAANVCHTTSRRRMCSQSLG